MDVPWHESTGLSRRSNFDEQAADVGRSEWAIQDSNL
jgi:hypothetical protein